MKLEELEYDEHVRSHHTKSIIYWVTEGIIIDNKRYHIEEFRLEEKGLYGVITRKRKHYKVLLSVFDDTEIMKQLEILRATVNSIEKYDDKEIKDRLTALESKPDVDTKYKFNVDSNKDFITLTITGTDGSEKLVKAPNTSDEISALSATIKEVNDKIQYYTAGAGLNLVDNKFSIDNTVVTQPVLSKETSKLAVFSFSLVRLAALISSTVKASFGFSP